jgi:AraC family transcriptional regulator
LAESQLSCGAGTEKYAAAHWETPRMAPARGTRTLEREVATSICRVQLVSTDWNAPIEIAAETVDHRLQLSLLPQTKGGTACFPRLWGPHRFASVGEVFFYPAGQMLHVRAECKRQESIVCIFKPEMAARFLDSTIEWTTNRLVAGLDIANPAIRNLLLRLAQELRQPGHASDTYVELLAGQMLIELSRYFLNVGQTEAGGGLSPWRLKLIDERLREDGPVPTLTELAELCNLSVRHLTRAFRATRGRSIGDYIAEQRMERAKVLLLSGIAVRAVSQQIGFNSPNNFSSAFRRMSGESPREFVMRSARAKGPSPVGEPVMV